MARILASCACLLAILAMAGAMPAQSLPIVDEDCVDPVLCLVGALAPVQVLAEPAQSGPSPSLSTWDQASAADLASKGPACMDTEDDTGMGGSHASCGFRCGIGAVIAIGVKASDPQATAYGDAACDTAEASCLETGPVCAMVSPGVAKNAADGSCSGSSEEFWDSPVLVACIATVPGPDSDPGQVAEDAKEALCHYSNICPSGGGGFDPCGDATVDCDVATLVCQVLGCPIDSPCGDDCMQLVRDSCANVADRLGRIVGNLDRLLADETVEALLATVTDLTGSLAVSYNPSAGCEVVGQLA